MHMLTDKMRPMPEQKPAERVKNFQEVALGYTEEDALAEAKRCLECAKPLCRQGCPVNVDIPGFIKLVQEGDFLAAAALIKEYNSLPAICGRVCPQEDQCEKHCIVGKKADPVGIGRLERFVADYVRQKQENAPPNRVQPRMPKVAVIGAGPAGLAAAGELAKKGYRVTIFEALHEPGGVLMYGIPEFRLPKDIVRAEIDYLRKIGVNIVVNAVVGQTFTIDGLFEAEGFKAVFIGSGAGLPHFLGIPGENLNGVYSANEFLTRANLMKAYDFPHYRTPLFTGERVAVVGGGNVAMDAARTARRLGAKQVYVIYRRSEAEMPARREEAAHAREEQISFCLLASPVAILGNAQGWVEGIKCVRMKLEEPDAGGRRRPVAIPHSEFILAVNSVIVAIGQGPNPLIPRSTPGLGLTKNGNILISDAQGETSRPGVFAGGDIVTGAATVIQAMGAGKKAARAIHEYLQKKETPSRQGEI
ncbi:MAG TPA: NADPH-dependent glutamate synthase [Negativicutes bacterium]|nr:NADPH-dependent glutamate synthase [Negativicutes bacterium]